MTVFIIGAGFTGQQLARRLIARKCDVVLIDSDPVLVEHVSNRLDCMVVCGSGNDLRLLKDSGIAKAQAIVAVTASDEVNMIICSLVSTVFPKIIKIARVRNHTYHESNILALSEKSVASPYEVDFMVNPDHEAAEAIIRAVERGGNAIPISFDGSDYELVTAQIEEGSAFDGILVKDLRKAAPFEFLLASVETETESAIPTGATYLKAGDSVSVLATCENAKKFFALAGAQIGEIKNIVILGANQIGVNIVERLLNKDSESQKGFFAKFNRFRRNFFRKFAIIEENSDLAKAAASRFREVSVFNADISDENFVEEEKISQFDLLVAVNSNCELNIVNAAYLKSQGIKKAICLVSAGKYTGIARNIGIDVPVPICDAVVDCIMSRLSGQAVTEIHTISSGQFEVAEIVMGEGAPFDGKSLKEIASAGEFLVLMILDEGEKKYRLAGGNSVLRKGSKMIVLFSSDDGKKVLKNFGC